GAHGAIDIAHRPLRIDLPCKDDRDNARYAAEQTTQSADDRDDNGPRHIAWRRTHPGRVTRGRVRPSRVSAWGRRHLPAARRRRIRRLLAVRLRRHRLLLPMPRLLLTVPRLLITGLPVAGLRRRTRWLTVIGCRRARLTVRRSRLLPVRLGLPIGRCRRLL